MSPARWISATGRVARARAAAGLAVVVVAAGIAVAAPPALAAPQAVSALDRRPDAIVDLRTDAGIGLVGGSWKVAPATLAEIDFRNPGPDLKPSGAPNRTYDIVPKPGGAGFDEASWRPLAASALESRLGTGKLSFNWYRLSLTIPERIGAFETAGSTAVFEIVVDDYAEIWVDGALPRVLGQQGGALVAGYNSPNRVVVARDAKPGRKIQIAVLGANGPLSDPPANFIWVRSATLDFYAPPRPPEAGPAAQAPPGGSLPAGIGRIVRLDPALDAIVTPASRIEKLASGFSFVEGPVWHPDGYLLFSDPNENTIYRYTPDGADSPGAPSGQLSVFRTKSGYTGGDLREYGQPGSNGLALDAGGRLTIDEHGNRRVTRLEKNGTLTVLADRYDGKRLNSPNDLVYRSDGALYFTDPPFGLPKFFDDPRKELPWSGVYRVAGGTVSLVSKELAGPNGLAFSPDEKFLYVSNWDTAKKVVTRYEVLADGSLAPGKVFFDMGGAPGQEALDGLKVDAAGNLYVSGPGGVWILSPSGAHLGTIVGPELPANFAWGGADRRTLYMTARTGLYRIRLGLPGAGAVPGSVPAAAGTR